MIGVMMTIPRDVLRFEVLLYLSLLVDALSAAFFGAGEDSAARASVALFSAIVIAAYVGLVWLAARRQKNWARWTTFGFFVFTVILYIQSFGELAFSAGTLVDMLSLALSALGFYFAFTSEAQQWFKGANP
jgi:hypothetical protein